MLLDVPFVCKSWSKATLRPLCWRRLVFPGMSQGPWYYNFFTYRLMEEYQVLGVGVFPITSFMKSVINRSDDLPPWLHFPAAAQKRHWFMLLKSKSSKLC
ncbi:hypothetical protein Vadar_012604 [Vaccinium darrowii]|uniref:Uncharacterized protein n=1 Tax=Vaccinium darrowii TaxID=229202 RepID=A0ACB7YVZ3_9ERIC|nr:hypothetical protein Vadar_012604 [Vaccinium darrowii]